MGPEMMQKFRDQAERFGARLLTEQADRVELASEPGGIHSVWVGDTEYRARTVVLAMGAEHKKLVRPRRGWSSPAAASATARPATRPSSATPRR